jgi:transposase
MRGNIIGVTVTEDAMSKLLVTDDLWAVVEPLLPKHEPSPAGGHPRVDDRVCLTGILFVLKTGIPWEDFPQEMGCCGMTLWNRLDEWRRAGVWPGLHEVLLAHMRGADLIDFSRAVADSSSVRAVHGGKKRDRAPWTAANAGANTTCWSRPAARPWSPSSRVPTATTVRS